MPASKHTLDGYEQPTCSFEEIAVDQLRQFRKLTFKDKILCLEGMAQVVTRFQGKAAKSKAPRS